MRQRRNTTMNTTIDFDKAQLIDKRLIDKSSLWILRIVLNLGGHRDLIDKDNYVHKDNIFAFLDGNKFVDTDEEKFSREIVMDFFRGSLIKLEEQKKFKTNKILFKNIAQISSLMKLNKYEEQILEFVTLIKQFELLDDAVGLLGNELNSTQAKRALSVILNIKKKDIDSAFASDSKLSKSSLVTIDKANTNSLNRKLDSISDTFLDNLLNYNEPLKSNQ